MSEFHLPALPDLLRVGDVAKILHVTTRTVDRLLAAGDLPVTEIGGSVRVRRDELERFVIARTRRRGQAA